ncbi:hypothetical protein EMIT0P218_30246 [Pseudomonas sp. IT-P218]
MTWHNTVHRHSRIRFVAPAQRHDGKDADILARRDAIYGLPEKEDGNGSRVKRIT